MKKNLPYHRARLVFVWSILILAIMGFAYRLFVLNEPSVVVLLRFTLPLLIFGLIYKAEYHHRITEKICRAIRTSQSLHTLLFMFISGTAVVCKHHHFLSWFLPLGFVVCQWVIEKSENTSHDSRLIYLLVETVIFLGLSLKFTYYSAAALTVAVISIVLLMQLMASGNQEGDFWKALFGLAILTLWIGALIPQLLDRLFYIAVNQKDFLVCEGCMEVFTVARPWGQAELVFTNFRDLLPYPPGYLIAKFGWLSVLPLLCITCILLISGFCLFSQKIPRHTSTLAAGCYVLLVIRLLSFYLTGASIIVGFEDIPFYDGNILDMLLAVIIMQPINPKQLNEIHSPDSEPDYHMMETSAIIMLPHSRQGAESLGQYVFSTPNHVGWTVLIKEFWEFFDSEERKTLLLQSADLFDTHNELKKIHPEYYIEEEPVCITSSN